jgi:hypothetical protein
VLQQRGLTALVVLLGLALISLGQDKDQGKAKIEGTPLKWKFEKDKTFYQEMKTETKQTMKVMGSEVVQNQDQTFYFSWTPTKVEGDTVTIRQKIEGVKMSIDIGGSKINYDSTAAQPASNPLSDFFKQLVGAEFTLTLDTKTMKVTKIEGRDKFVENLVKANPQMKPLLEQILSEEALKEMADPTFAAIPAESVAKGQTWTRETKLNMGPIGTYENSYKYTYEGPDGKLQKIKVDTTLKYVPPSETTPTGGLPFKIKSADLQSKDASGTILFDTEKGRVDKSEMNIKLEGKLSIEIGGQTTTVELSQTQKTTVTTSDTNPIKKS